MLPPSFKASARIFALGELACAPYPVRQRWTYRVAEDHIAGLVRSDVKLHDALLYFFATMSEFDRLPAPLHPRSRKRVYRIAAHCVAVEKARRAKLAARKVSTHAR